MDTITVKPAAEYDIFNCDTGRQIKCKTQVSYTPNIAKLLKNGDLEIVEEKSKAETKSKK